jgi:hypothetical protein
MFGEVGQPVGVALDGCEHPECICWYQVEFERCGPNDPHADALVGTARADGTIVQTDNIRASPVRDN